MTQYPSEDFFINTIKPRRKSECAASAVIAGANGCVGPLLARALSGNGCKVSLFTDHLDEHFSKEDFHQGSLNDLLEPAAEEVFEQGAVLYIPCYSLEPYDIAPDNLEFVYKLRERAEAAGFSRIVLITGVARSDRPEYERVLRRLKLDVEGDGHVPVSHFEVSLVTGKATALENAFSDFGAPAFILPPEANKRECNPVSIDDLILYLLSAHEAELPRHYSFEVGGPIVLSFEKATEFLLKNAGKSASVSLGRGLKKALSAVAFDREVAGSSALRSYLEQTQYSMLADTDPVRSYYPDIEPVAPLLP